MTRAIATSTVLVLVTLWMFTGCSPIPEFGETSPQELYVIGVESAASGDYMIAIEAFRRVTAQWPLDPLADDALVGLADAYRETGDYALAETEYIRVLTDYPDSELVADVEYKLGLTYADQSRPAQYDQEMTREAIRQFERFIRLYPGSDHVSDALDRIEGLTDRLAEKEYRAAMLYVTLNDPQAARVYFNAVVERFPDSSWAPRALLEIVRTHVAEGDMESAEAARDRLVELYPESDAVAEVETALQGDADTDR